MSLVFCRMSFVFCLLELLLLLCVYSTHKSSILPVVCVCVCFLWNRQMLFCRVTLGKSFLQFSAMKMAHAPPGHHSVIGRPSVNGLAYAEYVIYRGEQVSPALTFFCVCVCLLCV